MAGPVSSATGVGARCGARRWHGRIAVWKASRLRAAGRTQLASASWSSGMRQPTRLWWRVAALKPGFDEALGCHTVLVPDRSRPAKRDQENEDERFDHLDRWPLTLRNDSDQPTVMRVMFIQNRPPDITGFTPMLCEPDGTPTGLPVQISKNWHQRPEKGVLPHQGPWFHGFAYVRLAPKSSRELVFRSSMRATAVSLRRPWPSSVSSAGG